MFKGLRWGKGAARGKIFKGNQHLPQHDVNALGLKELSPSPLHRRAQLGTEQGGPYLRHHGVSLAGPGQHQPLAPPTSVHCSPESLPRPALAPSCVLLCWEDRRRGFSPPILSLLQASHSKKTFPVTQCPS